VCNLAKRTFPLPPPLVSGFLFCLSVSLPLVLCQPPPPPSRQTRIGGFLLSFLPPPPLLPSPLSLCQLPRSNAFPCTGPPPLHCTPLLHPCLSVNAPGLHAVSTPLPLHTTSATPCHHTPSMRCCCQYCPFSHSKHERRGFPGPFPSFSLR
jgi:hypothetical protein